MKYKINPCKACHKKWESDGCDINDLNDCYTSVLASYSGVPNNSYILDGDWESDWKNCMTGKMAVLPQVAGRNRSFCNFQLNTAPVFVEPRFFPHFLQNSGGNKNIALNKCFNQCKQTKSPNECMNNCKLDHDALEEVQENYGNNF